VRRRYPSKVVLVVGVPISKVGTFFDAGTKRETARFATRCAAANEFGAPFAVINSVFGDTSLEFN
jgi:hypothetical protein